MDYIEAMLIAVSDGSALVSGVVTRLRKEWPEMLINVIPDEDDEFTYPDRLEHRLRAFNGEVAITPDRDVCDRWDVEGYKDYGNGRGPVILSYSPCVIEVLKTQAPVDISARTGDITYNLTRGDDSSDNEQIPLFTEGLTILNVITPDETNTLREMIHRLIHQELLDLAGTMPASTFTRLDSDPPGKNNWPVGH